jgi:YegS/Rv2252/BmrU family lipid kinase
MIAEQLRALNVEFEMMLTRAPGHASELAEQAAAAGWDVVAAVGGDGTLNEVLNGLVKSHRQGNSHAALGLIPVGRGNDFGFGVGVPMDWRTACSAMVTGQRKWIDVGFVQGGDYPEGRYFGNGVGIGFDAVVGFEAAKLKRLHGFPSYIVAALKTIFLYYRAPQVHLEWDGQSLTMFSLMVSVMNGRRMGGGFMMAPEAQVDDASFDLCLAGQVSRLRIFGLIPKFMQGTQAGHPAIRFLRTNHLVVTALQGVLPAHADGETLCVSGQRLELTLLPKMLEVIVPAGVQEN